MRERIHVYPEEDTGGFIAIALDFPGCPTVVGDTYEQAIQNIRIPLALERAALELEQYRRRNAA